MPLHGGRSDQQRSQAGCSDPGAWLGHFYAVDPRVIGDGLPSHDDRGSTALGLGVKAGVVE